MSCPPRRRDEVDKQQARPVELVLAQVSNHMRTRSRMLATVTTCCLLFNFIVTSRSAASDVTDRPFAPAFSLSDIAGKSLNLTDYRGKVVLLNFWATWCGPCRVEAPGFVNLLNRYREAGLVVIGISLDDEVEPVRTFYSEYELNYPVALGNERLSEEYGGVFSLPATFVIGRDNRIYAKHLGAVDVPALESEILQLLSSPTGTELSDFKPAAQQWTRNVIEPENAQEVASEVPGVDLTSLSYAQTQTFKKQLEALECECGCRLNVLQCRVNDSQCTFSLQKARKRKAYFAHSRKKE